MSHFARRTWLLCAIAGGVVWGQAVRAQAPLEQAVTLAREKRYADANRILQGVAEPEQPVQRIAFHRLKAAVAAGMGNNPEAAKEMRKALELSPTEPTLLMGAAVAEMQAGEFKKVLVHAKGAGEIATAKALLASAYEKTGAVPDAVHAWSQAIALDPGNESYRFQLAFDLIATRNFVAADELLQRSIPLFRGSVRLRTLLGITQYARSETEEAVQTLNAAIALDPKEEANYQCLTQIVLRSAAPADPKTMANLCRWNAVVCSALKLRLAREKDDAAMQGEAIAGLRSAPRTDVVVRCELARAWEWAGRLEEARKEMEACLHLDPSAQNHYRMGILYQRLGLAALAKREMEIRNQMVRDTPEDMEAGLSTLKAFRPGGVP